MKYLYGFHDPGGEHLMLQANRPGWIVFTEAIGCDANNRAGIDYRPYSSQGLGVIVRLNNGYGSTGTIPLPHLYHDFAQRCAYFVAASPGASRWIIGNEPNHAQERPDNQEIKPAHYATAYRLCRNAIHAVPGHEADEVLVAGPAPWNGDWLNYFQGVNNLLGLGVDGYAIHCYTHGDDPELPFSDEKNNGWYWHLKTYLDQLNCVPAGARRFPVYATESNQGDHAWTDRNSGWVQNAYRAIHTHNETAGTQKIRCLCLYRWPQIKDQHGNIMDKWYIEGKNGVIEDFKAALAAGYPSPVAYTIHVPNVEVTPPTPPVPAPTPLDWDSRLTARGVKLARAQVAPGQKVWRIVKAVWMDEHQSQGRHHIYADTLGLQEGRATGVRLDVRWPSGQSQIVSEAKPGEAWATNFPMSPSRNEFSVRVAGEESDTLLGIGMGMETPGGYNAGIHTSTGVVFRLMSEPAVSQPTPPTVPPAGATSLLHPIENAALRIVTQPFGPSSIDYSEFGHIGHAGIDYGVPEGTPVRAGADGVAVEVGNLPASLGLYVKLRTARGEDLVYGHLKEHRINMNMAVSRGQIIGLSGSSGNATGPHLHFAYRPNYIVRGGDYDGYVDPAPLLETDLVPSPRPSTVPALSTLLPLIKEAAAHEGIDWELLLALVKAESSYNPQAVSPAGAMGLCQIMPATWAEWAPKVGASDPYNPRDSLRVGAAYYHWCLRLLNGNRILAMTAYNLGIGNVQGGAPVPIATQIYAAKVVFGAELLKEIGA